LAGVGTPGADCVAGAGAFFGCCSFCQASHNSSSEKLKMKNRISLCVSMALPMSP
jgi:hypothetical protein